MERSGSGSPTSKLIEVARSQIQAVEPLWNSPERAGTPDDTRDRAYTIIISALDSLLRAQALTDSVEETSSRQRHSQRSIAASTLCYKGARVLRLIYYFWFIQLSFAILVAISLVGDKTAKCPHQDFLCIVCIGRGDGPSCRNQIMGNRPRAPSRACCAEAGGRDTPPPPGPRYPVEGLRYGQPRYNPSLYSEQSVHSKPPAEHQPPNSPQHVLASAQALIHDAGLHIE